MLFVSTADDFDGMERSSSFPPGLVQQPPFVILGSQLAVTDSLPEFTEGFVVYLKIDRSSLHESDRDRLQVVNPVVLVSIKNNQRKWSVKIHSLKGYTFVM